MICADIAQSVLADEGDNCKLSYGLGSHKSGPQQQLVTTQFHLTYFICSCKNNLSKSDWYTSIQK